MAKDVDNGNGVTITATKSGATIHLKWALIAVVFAGGGMFSGRAFLPTSRGDDAVVEVKKTLTEHCGKQAQTESAQREQMVELKTKLENMSQDLRDIKQMLMRTQRGVGYSPQVNGTDS